LKLFLFLFLFPLSIWANNPTTSELRTWYFSGIEQSEFAEKLYSETSKIKNPSALQLAYYGASLTLLAKHSWNPYNKIDYLKKAEKIIAQSIKLAPNNIEIRFLRYSYERYLPDFLLSGNHMETDKKVIISQMQLGNNAQLSSEVLYGMVSFLIDSGRCTPVETTTLKKLKF
jgi:tetratricopeptide (TPR) repeat protein